MSGEQNIWTKNNRKAGPGPANVLNLQHPKTQIPEELRPKVEELYSFMSKPTSTVTLSEFVDKLSQMLLPYQDNSNFSTIRNSIICSMPSDVMLKIYPATAKPGSNAAASAADHPLDEKPDQANQTPTFKK
jgi:hypothetical protein